MANPRNKPQRKGATPSVDALIRATIADLRNMAANSKGKPKYIENLDAVLYEIYGVKKIGSRFCSGKKQLINKVINKIDFKSLVLMIKGSVRQTKGLLAATVKIHAKIENDYESSTKEIKKAKKTIAEACSYLRKSYHIEKYKDPSDVSVKDLRKFLDNNDYSYDYDYDIDDDDDNYSYDDDVDFGNGGSAIEDLFNKCKESSSPYYEGIDDDDDDDSDEIRKTISSGDIANDKLDDLIDKVITPMVNRIEFTSKHMSSIDEKLDRLSRPMQNNSYVPLPKEPASTANASGGDMKAIAAALTAMNKKLAANDARFDQLANTTNTLTEVVRGIIDDMRAEEEYEDDEPDDPDAVSMDTISASFTGLTEPEEPQFHEPSSPIPLKS